MARLLTCGRLVKTFHMWGSKGKAAFDDRDHPI